MDQTTRNLALTLASGVIKKGLIAVGMSIATHGWIASNQVELFAAVGMAGVGIVWSLWNDYGRAIVLSQLEVLKAKSLAQAAALRSNGVKQVSVSDIAAQSPTMNAASVVKAIASLPVAVQANVARLVLLFAVSLVLCGVLSGGRAIAADLPVKTPAPAVPFLGSSYPYDNSGFFVGLFTEGTGGSVAASVPGVNSASLTTTTAALGLTAGYAWGSKGSPIAYTLEGDLKVQNFNGSNAGFSLQGPLGFAARGVVFAPWDRIFGALNLVNPFGAIPPFAPLQPGVTASNLQLGAGLEFAFNDISLSYLGTPAGKVWQFEPKLVLVQMQQLSTGIAVRSFEKIGFPDKGAIIGPAGARAVQGINYTFGLGAYF